MSDKTADDGHDPGAVGVMDQWTVELVETPLAWSDEWTPAVRRVEIEHVVLKEIIELDAGDPGLFRTLVDMFRHDTETHIPLLIEAASSADVACLTNIGHSLAGEAAQIGAASIATHCRAIESAALRDEFAHATRLVEALSEHLDQFTAAVELQLAPLAS